MVSGGGGLWEVTRSREWSPQGEDYIKETAGNFLSTSSMSGRGGYETGSGLSPDTRSARALIWDFQPPKLWLVRFCGVQAPWSRTFCYSSLPGSRYPLYVFLDYPTRYFIHGRHTKYIWWSMDWIRRVRRKIKIVNLQLDWNRSVTGSVHLRSPRI